MSQYVKTLNSELQPSLKDLTFYFLGLGTTGFGGPIALVSYMQRDLVEKKGWFSQETFKEGVALAQLAPGPLAAQLAIYLGWAHSGVLGATVIGTAFVIPSFIMVVVLAIFYIRLGSVPLIQQLFHGIGPAAIAVICVGAYKLTKKNLERHWELWIVAVINAAAVVITQTEMISLFLVSGIAVMLIRGRPSHGLKTISIIPPIFLMGQAGVGNADTLKDLLLFFTKAGAFVFGSGLAIVPFLHGGVVVEHGWLTESQFLDAVAVAMITPGPVVITVSFIGFLVAGFAGAVVAAIGVFLPCYLFTIIPAPYFSRISKNKLLKEFVNGVTCAAIGAILGAVIILGKGSLIDLQAAVIFFAVLLGILFVKKVPEPIWILLAGILGVLLAK